MPSDGVDPILKQLPAERLALLRCVSCDARGPLEEVAREAGTRAASRIDGGLAPTSLRCTICARRYPITADGIPIVWTDELRRCLSETGPSASSPMSANVSVYDHVSDDYAAHWRQQTRNARRVQAAARRALNGNGAAAKQPTLRHLDVGCGPGHVLHWLAEFGAQQCAVDVSLSNLRNVRKTTGAFVVLGSADRLPLADGTFDLVTESSVLHHVERWEEAVAELARCCAPGGGVVIDSEPSRESKRWNRLATAVFEMRWYPYVLLSYVSPSKFWFRDARTARLTFERAEIHNRPNTGLPVKQMVDILESAGMRVEAVPSPDEQLEPKAWITWQEMLLHTLSGHNPLNPKWGWVTVVAHRPANGEREREDSRALVGAGAAGGSAS